MSFTRAVRFGFSAMAVLAVVLTALAGAGRRTRPRRVVVTGGVDFPNQYKFRGIRQNTDGVSIWPYVDFGLTPYHGRRRPEERRRQRRDLERLQHADRRRHDCRRPATSGTSRDFYATLGLGFGGGVSLGTTYTAYTSPANLFAHVKEIAFKLASTTAPRSAGRAQAVRAGRVRARRRAARRTRGDARASISSSASRPGYAGVEGVAGGPDQGRPERWRLLRVRHGRGQQVRLLQRRGIVTVPMGAHANIHGGVEFQAFGDNVKAYNGSVTIRLDPSGSAVDRVDRSSASPSSCSRTGMPTMMAVVADPRYDPAS